MPVNPSSKTCVQDEMDLWKQGKLHSGSGHLVPSGEKGRKQALAISLNACQKSNFSERLANIGFSEESLKMAEGMLVELPDWGKQFETGRTGAKVIRENKITRGIGLPDMDIDNRTGRQKGDQGKRKEEDSASLSAVAVPKGNPQQGPRSRSDLTGLRMFQELPPLTGECNQEEKRKQRQQQRTPQEKKGDLERAKELQGKPVAPNTNREAAAKKAAETRKKCKTQGPGSKVPNTNPAGAGTGAGGGAGGGAASGFK